MDTRQIQMAIVRVDMAIVAVWRVARIVIPVVIAFCLIAWACSFLWRRR